MKMTSIFKKASIFASAIVLVLVMVVSVVPAVFAEEPAAAPTTGPSATGETLVASNITISGNIAMTYYYQGLGEFADTDYILITVPNQNNVPVANKIYFSEIKNTYDAEKDRWAVTVPVAYAQQTVDIKMQWFKGETAGKERVRTVKDYAESVLTLANAGDSTYVAVAPAVTNMLNAGAMAQVALGYNTDNLANAGLFDADNPIDGMLAEHFYGVEDKVAPVDPVDQITFIGADVLLQSKVNLRVYLTCPDNVTTATVSYGSETVTVKIKGNNEDGKYVGINNILASSFDKRYTVTVGENSYTYSVLDYAMDTLNAYFEDDVIGAAKKNTAKALYLFYASTKAYVTKDSETPFVAGPADCQHARTHMDKTGKIVCSDCHKVVDGASIKLSVSSDTVKLVKGETKNVKLTFALNGNVDLTGIIFTPKCDGLTLERVDANIDENYFGEFGKNAVVLGKEANDTLGAGTIATATYAITATETGTYKITVKVHQATVGTADASGTVSAGYAAVEVVAPLCESHTFTYTHAGAKHLARCTECPYVEYADHTYVSTVTDADGVRTYNSSICSVCGIPSVNNIKSTYTLGFTVDGEGNKTEKAPLLVLTPQYLTTKTTGHWNVTKSDIKTENGVDYVTFSNDPGKGEAYFTVFSGNNPIGETGRYMVIKYRTTYSANFDIWVGANHGRTSPGSPSSNFYFTTSQGVLKNDGKWQVVIVDLEAMRNLEGNSSVFEPEDGTTDTYYADYMRFDIFNSNPTTQETFDVAYIAFSNDIMSLASFDGNDSYLVTANSYKYDYTNTSGKPATDWYAKASYTGSTKTLGTTCFHAATTVVGCDAVCVRCEKVMSTTHTAGTEYYSVNADPQNEYTDCTACGATKVASRVIDSTFKGLTLFTPEELVACGASNASETVVTENGITFARIVSTHATGAESTLTLNNGKSNLTGAGKYLAVMLRKSSGGGHFEAWVNDAGTTDHTNGKGTQTAKNQQYNIPNDNTWYLYIYAHGKDTTNGLGWTRLDVLNGSGAKAGDTIDIAWVGFFASEADANAMFTAYINAYDACDHSDKNKLANIENVEIDGSVFTATADCNACGQKGVYVTLETNDALKIFNPGELLSLSAATLKHNVKYQLITNDELAGNVPYIRYTSMVNASDIYFTLGSGTWGPAGKYVAILYRRDSSNPGVTKNDNMQVLYNKSGTTGSSGHKSFNLSTTSHNGKWNLEIKELNNDYIADGKLGWTRLDIFNGSAPDTNLDIAYIGFFNSTESANAFYASFMDTHHMHSFDHSKATKSENAGMVLNTCLTCSETVEMACPHSHTYGYTVAPITGTSLKEQVTCNLCGNVAGSRDIWFRGWFNNVYLGSTAVKGISFGIRQYASNDYGTYPTEISLKDKGSATTIKIVGWFVTNGGVKDYYYRVNGGDWIKITNKSTLSTANTGIFNDFNGQNKYISDCWGNSQFNGHLTTDDLSVKYGGKTVKVDFGFCPANNPGTDAAPNIQIAKTFKDVSVAAAAAAAE